MERLEITPLENLAEELAGVEYTIRKKSLLKRQLRDLKKKLARSLPVIEEEKYENQEGNKKVTVFYKFPSRTLLDIQNFKVWWKLMWDQGKVLSNLHTF